MTKEEKQFIQQIADTNEIPFKVAQKWFEISQAILKTTHQLSDIKWQPDSQQLGTLNYKSWQMWVEIVEKGQFYVMLYERGVQMLSLKVQNTTEGHLTKVCQVVLLVMNAKPGKGVMKVLKPENSNQ